MAEDRIPQGVRKIANRLGPGRYRDPSTGRIYIDSADMDDTFEKMIDDTASADAKRIAEMDAAHKLPVPPTAIQEQAHDHLHRHANRMLQRQEDTSWGGRAGTRREKLLARKLWKESLGETLEEDDQTELAELEKALAPTEEENEA